MQGANKGAENITIPTMLPIPKAAAVTGLAQEYLRGLCRTGRIVHVKSGRKFIVNMEKLAEFLDEGDVLVG